MIRAIAHDKTDGHPIVMLGLEDGNLARLVNDQPIRVNLAELVPGQATDLPNISVVIFHATADAERAMLEMFANREITEAGQQ